MVLWLGPMLMILHEFGPLYIKRGELLRLWKIEVQ